MEKVKELLAELVSIPSMNPMGRSRSGPEYAEGAIADFVASYLRGRSIDVAVDEVAPGRPNVIGYIDAGARETLMLEAHLDTVHADNMVIEPFVPKEASGNLYGRGSCDTKAALAAFLRAACSVLERGKKPRYNVVMVATADEEYRFTGAQRAVAHGLKATFGIAGEPTQLHVVSRHKGVTRWRVVAHGRAAHSAYPDRGDNAIYTMGEILVRLDEYAEALSREIPHHFLGTPTLSVGVIEGGQAVNIVPDQCWIEIDRRTLPGETTEQVLQPVRCILREVPNWTFEEPHLSVPGMAVSEEAKIMNILKPAIAGVLGAVQVESAYYATDAGIYNAAGIPTVVFGPGDIAQAHTNEEFVELKQVYQAVEIVSRLLLN